MRFLPSWQHHSLCCWVADSKTYRPAPTWWARAVEKRVGTGFINFWVFVLFKNSQAARGSLCSDEDQTETVNRVCCRDCRRVFHMGNKNRVGIVFLKIFAQRGFQRIEMAKGCDRTCPFGAVGSPQPLAVFGFVWPFGFLAVSK